AAPAHLVAVDAATSTVSVMATDPRRLFAVACAAAGEPAACRDPETTADVIQRASILGSTAPAVSSQIVAIGAAALWRSRAALYLGGALLSIVAVVVARRLATHSRAAFAAAAVFAVACAAMAIRYLPNHEESAAGTIRVATAREEVPPSTLPVVRATPAAPHDSGAHQLVEEKTRRVIAKVLGVEYEKVTPFTEVPRNAKVSCHVALQEAFDVDFPWSDVPNTVLGLVELIERLPKGRIRFSLPS
ncbi:MAG TPA: hypothetical protein VF698_17200, partial [Thermoanaerobaculia bacterium]